MGEVRIIMDEEEQKIKENELNLEIPDEEKEHCTPGTQTRNTSLLLED